MNGFKLLDEVLDVFGVDEKNLEFRSDKDFILYEGQELWVDIVKRHVEFLFESV